jgi:hypothetical protein
MKTNTLKNVVVALVLGALGSGLWSLLGEPMLDWFIRVFISFANIINESYYDLLHANIGKGFHEAHSLFFRGIFAGILLIISLSLPIVVFLLYKRTNSISEEEPSTAKEERTNKTHNRRKISLIFTLIYSVIYVPFYTSDIIINFYNNEAIVFSERAIEIISPEIEPEEVLKFRAQYRSIENSEDFYLLYDNIEIAYKKHELELPEFEIAR